MGRLLSGCVDAFCRGEERCPLEVQHGAFLEQVRRVDPERTEELIGPFQNRVSRLLSQGDCRDCSKGDDLRAVLARSRVPEIGVTYVEDACREMVGRGGSFVRQRRGGERAAVRHRRSGLQVVVS